ncbi:MAG: PSD1 and planctomycete cytochrome C domain-containing protein [Pirellulaceae bacterium]
MLAEATRAAEPPPAEPPPDPAQIEFFEKQIRPLLANHCHECHGPDKQEGKLRLDSRAGALAGGEYGPAVVAGKPDESWLVKAIRYDHDDVQMPPKAKLPVEKIEALTAWIKLGAPWPETAGSVRPAVAEEMFEISAEDRAYWAFQPVGQSPLPEVRDAAWAQSPVDRFVLARLEAHDLPPAPPAERRTLLRRIHFDLVGLPPTPDEMEAFLADDSPDATARAVDRLLASPHYGERWGRHWLDVARYGEDQAHTFEARKYPDGFRYRDWVIGALNRDLPYDQFVQQQIAGDLLDGPDRAERLAAVGFLSLGPVYYGRAVADEIDDRIDTVTRGVLGLTVACARCHDHKFDPVGTADYYALAGVFASTQYKEYVLTEAGEVDDSIDYLPTDKRKGKDKDKEQPVRPVIHSLQESDKPADMRIHLRGNADNLGDEVPRRFLAILSSEPPPPFTQGSGRLELSQALIDPENPLTARVLVNRVWAQHFGVGIVPTPSNFGALGQPPSHPELLDWLASRFMAQGWSLKTLHRRLMLTAVYQQSSGQHRANAAKDPDNRWLWRMHRRRLEVEPWRDAMLAAAGNLAPQIGGPSEDLSAPANRRRTLYGEVSRHNLHPVLRLFDFPDPNLTSDRRAATIVPLQQLYVLNSEFLALQADGLAERALAASADDEARIRHAYELAFGRWPNEREVQLGREFLATANNDTSDEDQQAVWQQYAHALLGSNEFAFID